MQRTESSEIFSDVVHETDQLEGATGNPTDPPAESRSSAADAGLDDEAWFEPDLADDSELVDSPDPMEIPMSDLEDRQPASTIQSPEQTDYNAPGEIDIEELDEDDLSDTDLPPDARLDPLES